MSMGVASAEISVSKEMSKGEIPTLLDELGQGLHNQHELLTGLRDRLNLVLTHGGPDTMAESPSPPSESPLGSQLAEALRRVHQSNEFIIAIRDHLRV